jgi:hypothetical protein
MAHTFWPQSFQIDANASKLDREGGFHWIEKRTYLPVKTSALQTNISGDEDVALSLTQKSEPKLFAHDT